MAFDLSTTHEKVAGLLGDPTHVRWDEEQIELAIAQALGEISLAAGQTMTLKDLEDAAETSVPAQLAAALVSGAAGFCAAMRAGARADWESQAEGEPQRLSAWGEARLAEFRAQVSRLYAAEARLHSQRAGTAPWAGWPDDFGERGQNDL